jgi:hypothetical protein
VQQFNIYDIAGGGTPLCAFLGGCAVCCVFAMDSPADARRRDAARVHSDLALKHLPSIYRALNRIAEEQGISLEETPMVNYVDMRNGGRNR